MKNNAELIASGHELAKCLDSNTPLIDIAKMIVRLADKLEVTTLALREKTKQCEQLAAENDLLKSAHPQPFGGEMMKALDTFEKYQDEVPEKGMLDAFFILRDSICVETPATDEFLREVRARGHIEGAYFVANRMLAAWEAGFIEDTAKNAADIARMVLTSTDFMADAPDGDFDRAFADSVLAEIAAQLRQGGAA